MERVHLQALLEGQLLHANHKLPGKAKQISGRGKLFLDIYKYILLQLEFREVPHGDWVEINVPADDYDPSSSSSNSGMGGRYPFAAASVSSSGPMNMGLGGFSVRGRSKGGGGKGGDDDPTLKMHEQSYTLRGLAIGTSYEVIDPLSLESKVARLFYHLLFSIQARVRSRNAFGLSAQSESIAFHTFDIKEAREEEEEDGDYGVDVNQVVQSETVQKSVSLFTKLSQVATSFFGEEVGFRDERGVAGAGGGGGGDGWRRGQHQGDDASSSTYSNSRQRKVAKDEASSEPLSGGGGGGSGSLSSSSPNKGEIFPLTRLKKSLSETRSFHLL